ncbi:MAG: hypothetical protein AB7T06_29410 [Kofleriaceae bacterium]
MKRLTTLLLALAGATTIGCVATVGGNECTSERCADDDGSGSDTTTARDCSDDNDVKTVAKDITIDSDADFANLPKEAKGCWALDGVLRIETDKVTSLAKLGDLINVNDIEITDTTLTELDFLQDEVKVYGQVRVRNNSKLTSLAPLRASRYTGTVTEAFVPVLNISNNLELTSIAGIANVPEIKGELTVANNPKLASLELTSLTKIDGALSVTQNGITKLDLSQLANVASIEVSQNSLLTQISGLRATLIVGNVVLRQNPKLSQIGAMFSLTHIGGNLIVDDNDSLTTLNGLISSMQRVVGTVTIQNNQVLTDLGQLSHALQGLGMVSVTNNPVLGYCKAWEVDRCTNAPTVINSGNGNNPNNCQSWCP